jgi:8-oxo-dGTP diphosphatase
MSQYEFYKDRPEPKNNMCAAALIVKDGKVLMGLRKYSEDKIVWTFPGGRCEVAESLEEGLRREVFEEIGVTDLEIKKLLGEKPGAWINSEGVQDQVFMYECAIHQEPRLMEPEKFLEWKWISSGNLSENLLDQKDREFIALITNQQQ